MEEQQQNAEYTLKHLAGSWGQVWETVGGKSAMANQEFVSQSLKWRKKYLHCCAKDQVHMFY